jgi:hypothetical protein
VLHGGGWNRAVSAGKVEAAEDIEAIQDKGGSGFVVSHPCGGKKPQGWGTGQYCQGRENQSGPRFIGCDRNLKRPQQHLRK